MKEHWKTIDWSNGVYEVSDLGRIRRAIDGKHAKAGHILPTSLTPNGYVNTTAYLNKRTCTIHIHREVARACIPNPEGKQQVNHKNGVKSDNRASNLEWVTQSENMRHAQQKLGWVGRHGVPVMKITADGKVVAEYASVKEAAESLDGSNKSTRGCISVVCTQMSRKTFRKVFHRDYIWVRKADYSKGLIEEALAHLHYRRSWKRRTNLCQG